MGKIKKLPSNLIPKIAAGEVVERPSSVVKELVENALDAKATKIEIHIEKSGLKKIEVRDNGIGMDKNDTRSCAEIHTTSKLFSEKELLGITSLGFRGEALASIASISKLTIKSKTAKVKLGTQLNKSGGKQKKETRVGMPTGTIVTVENLFFNTPGRKKFLKTPQTESKHVIDVVTRNALAFPKVSFTLTHNQKTLIKLPNNQKLKERVNALLGKNLTQAMLPITHKKSHLELTGFISKPQAATKTRRNQFLFINNRPVRSTHISNAVKEGYNTLLETGATPAFVLFLKLPPESVDVNVHPRKEKINFQNEQLILNFITSAIQKTLNKYTLIYDTDIFGLPIGKYTKEMVKDSPKLWKAHITKKLDDSNIMQIQNLYLLIQTEKGILLVDQHAAHEKILYEQVLKNFEKESPKSISLPKPVVFDLPLTEAHTLKENLVLFRKLGCDIEEFGETSFRLNTLPQKIQKPVDFILSVIEDVIHERKNLEISKELVAQIACKHAVKAGETLTVKEIKRLVKKLLDCRECYTCPHGRPTMLEITLEDLAKMFKRK